jgi:hypothetical protein
MLFVFVQYQMLVLKCHCMELKYMCHTFEKKVVDIYNKPYILYEGTQTNHSSTKYQMTPFFII